MEAIGRGQTDPRIHGQYLHGRWPTRRKLMGRACRPNGTAHMVLHAASCSGPCARTVRARCTRVSPRPPHPRSGCHRRQLRPLGFSALHAPSLRFLSYPKPSCTAPVEAPNPPKSQPREEESKPSQLHRRLTTNERTSPLLPTHPCYPPFDTVACRSLALFPPFASSCSSSNTPPRNHQTVDRLATGPTSRAQTPHVWLAQRPPPPPPPSFMPTRVLELRSAAQ